MFKIYFLGDSQKAYGNVDFSKYSESLIDNTKALKEFFLL